MNGCRHPAIPISSEQMQALADEWAKTHDKPLLIETRPEHRQITFPSGRRFVAPLPLPEQRGAGGAS